MTDANASNRFAGFVSKIQTIMRWSGRCLQKDEDELKRHKEFISGLKPMLEGPEDERMEVTIH